MAFVLPIVSSFSTIAAAGSVAAAVSTVGGFLSVAGGVLAGVGALTGSKDLQKIGGFMALGSAAVNAASSASELVVDAAGEGAASSVEAADAMRAAEHGLGNVTSATQAPTLGTLGEAATASSSQPFMTPDALQTEALGAAQQTGGTQSLMQRASQVAQQGSTAQAPTIGQQLTGMAPQSATLDPVAQAGAGMDSNSLQSILGSAWDKTNTLAGGVGKFVKDNKELVQLGGGMLQSMYGPEAEAMDWQKSIMARRLRNLNNPIRLTATAGGV